ncbi:MAG: hypothetical protein P8X74_17080, partial [Reinekea sp.]
SDGWQRWQAKQGGFTVRCEGAATLKSNGSQIHKVSDGSYQVQASGPIRIEGKGEGDLVLMGGNGKGGLKIDKDGNIKVWGVQVTIKGRGAVNFNGKVEYDPGAGNEPENVTVHEAEEIPEIEPLTLENTEITEKVAQYYERQRKIRENESLYEQVPRKLRVRVKSTKHNPVPDIVVEAIFDDGTTLEATTDDNGFATFAEAPWSPAKIRPKDEKDYRYKALAVDVNIWVKHQYITSITRFLQQDIEHGLVDQHYQALFGRELSKDILNITMDKDSQFLMRYLLHKTGLSIDSNLTVTGDDA